jgi:hypothetical protein
MLLEVIKKGGKYFIKNVPPKAKDHFFIEADTNDLLEVKSQNNKEALKRDNGYIELKSLADKFPDDTFLQYKVKHYLPYKNDLGKTDKEIWNEGLMEKYGK